MSFLRGQSSLVDASDVFEHHKGRRVFPRKQKSQIQFGDGKYNVFLDPTGGADEALTPSQKYNEDALVPRRSGGWSDGRVKPKPPGPRPRGPGKGFAERIEANGFPTKRVTTAAAVAPTVKSTSAQGEKRQGPPSLFLDGSDKNEEWLYPYDTDRLHTHKKVLFCHPTTAGLRPPLNLFEQPPLDFLSGASAALPTHAQQRYEGGEERSEMDGWAVPPAERQAQEEEPIDDVTDPLERQLGKVQLLERMLQRESQVLRDMIEQYRAECGAVEAEEHEIVTDDRVMPSTQTSERATGGRPMNADLYYNETQQQQQPQQQQQQLDATTAPPSAYYMYPLYGDVDKQQQAQQQQGLQHSPPSGKVPQRRQPPPATSPPDTRRVPQQTSAALARAGGLHCMTPERPPVQPQRRYELVDDAYGSRGAAPDPWGDFPSPAQEPIPARYCHTPGRAAAQRQQQPYEQTLDEEEDAHREEGEEADCQNDKDRDSEEAMERVPYTPYVGQPPWVSRPQRSVAYEHNSSMAAAYRRPTNNNNSKSERMGEGMSLRDICQRHRKNY